MNQIEIHFIVLGWPISFEHDTFETAVIFGFPCINLETEGLLSEGAFVTLPLQPYIKMSQKGENRNVCPYV